MGQQGKNRVLLVGENAAFDRVKSGADQSFSRWDPVFARSLEEAVSHLSDGDFRAVVAAQLVGEANGELVLQEVDARWPQLARLTLTSEPFARPVWSTLAAVQAVPDECGPAQLEASIQRSANVHAIVSNPTTAALAGHVESLPTLPAVYRDLVSVASQKDVSAATVASALQRDPALCLKVLQVVNSLTFGLRRRISSVQQAAAYLGVELIKGIVVTAEIFKTAERNDVEGFSLGRFQDYSLKIATLASEFAATRGLGEEAFSAGLLHDVGKLVLSLKRETDFTNVLLRVAATGEDAESVEREVLGVSHSDVGAHLLWSWGIPYPIVECVAMHHATELAGDHPSDLVAIVHAAEALYSIYACGEREATLDVALLERAGMLEELDGWRQRVIESIS